MCISRFLHPARMDDSPSISSSSVIVANKFEFYVEFANLEPISVST